MQPLDESLAVQPIQLLPMLHRQVHTQRRPMRRQQ